MNLVIVESPTKAKTLSKYLPKDFEIKASMGHIRDLPKSGLGIDLENNFLPQYIVPEKAEKNLKEILKSAKGVSNIILATDPDREGEAIAWHLKELLETEGTKKKSQPVTFGRVVFHELTKEAVQEAFTHVGKLDMNLVDAQQARRVLDRLVGYKLSPLLWKKVRFGLSAGRVQSVAVRLVVEKERERQAFNIEEYWSIEGIFNSASKKTASFNLKADLIEKDQKKLEIKNETEATKIKNELENDSYTIEQIKKSERKKNPYPPLKTSTLQQSMANIHGFQARRTMQVAQKLFEKGFITYHRTDSLSLSPQFIASARSYIKKTFGDAFMPVEAIHYKTKSANAQEAHEAIRPTDVGLTPNDLQGFTEEEYKVYSLIWRRSIESQMVAAIYDQTSITIGSRSGYSFRATGSVVKFEGFLAIINSLTLEDEDSETLNQLPDYDEGEIMHLKSLQPEQHFTQPPARYTDATLIKKLEELGVGRPSTYAPTISTIQTRGYVTREGRALVPTDVAFVVVDLLVKYFSNVVDYDFTAKLELELDEVSAGSKPWVPVVSNFYWPFAKEIDDKEGELHKADITNLGESDEVCPECGKKLIFKLGKFGKFLSCSGFPECEFAKPLEDFKEYDENGNEIEDYGPCENCKDGKMKLKMGRFGKFLACSNYPKCKTAKPFLEKIGISCPKCSIGDAVVKKKGRRVFYGCSRYPECDFVSWADPRNPEAVKEAAAKKPVSKAKTKKTAVNKPAKTSKVKK